MIQFDVQPEDFPDDIEFVSENGRQLVLEKTAHLPMLSPRTDFVKFIALFAVGSIPVLAFIGIINLLLFPRSALDPLSWISMICPAWGLSFYFSIQSYRINQRLRNQGRVTVGKIARLQRTIIFSVRGYRPGLRVWFTYPSYKGVEERGMNLANGDKTFSNGFAVPEVGTSVAVLYLKRGQSILL